MYQAYWGLEESPFRAHLNPRRYYQGPVQEEALARLHFLADERRALGLLLGASGSGKSLLLHVFARQLGGLNRQATVVNLCGLNPRDFLWQLTSGLGLELRSQASSFAMQRALSDQIVANRYQQITTVLLLDDADTASETVIDQVIRLAQFEQTQDARLTIVLAAQTYTAGRLGTRIAELADLRIDLEGWDSDDTSLFIKRSLLAAGRTAPIFSEAAIARLHILSGGIPRRIKQLADMALLAGASQNSMQIEVSAIEAVARELGTLAGSTVELGLSR